MYEDLDRLNDTVDESIVKVQKIVLLIDQAGSEKSIVIFRRTRQFGNVVVEAFNICTKIVDGSDCAAHELVRPVPGIFFVLTGTG